MQVIVLALLAALTYAILTLVEHIRATPSAEEIREHASELKEWKRRNEKGVDGITCSRRSWQKQKHLNLLRERELLWLREGTADDAREQADFCRDTVVRWLRSGV